MQYAAQRLPSQYIGPIYFSSMRAISSVLLFFFIPTNSLRVAEENYFTLHFLVSLDARVTWRARKLSRQLFARGMTKNLDGLT